MTRRPVRARLGRLVLLWGVLTAMFSSVGHSQEDAAAQRLNAGDTTGALELLERLSRRRNRDAALHFRIGLLHLSRVRPNQAASAARRAAEDHLRLATRFAPDSAPYWLALADVLRSQTEVSVRLQVPGLLERAETAARRHHSPLLGEITYRLGRLNWERYEQAANRHELIDGSADVDQDRFLNDWQYVEDLFHRRLRPSFQGTVEWRQSLRYLDATLRSAPGHLDAAGLYLVALGEFDQWDSAAAVAARLAGALPDSGRAWLLHGLALTRTGRSPEAEAAFDSALARLAPQEAAPFLAFERLTPVASHQWRAEDPLWLTPVNEARTEFLARVVYADHRWSDALRGYRGYESDRGAVYLRYGPPDRAATLGPSGADRPALTLLRNPDRDDPDQFRGDAAERLDRELNRLLWVYEPSRRRYLFALTPGYARADFAGDAADRFATDQRRQPRSWDNVPIARGLDSLALTPLRFEDGEGRTELAVYGRLPPPLVRAMGGTPGGSVALFVGQGDTVSRLPDEAALPLSDGVWRWRIPWSFDTAASLRFEALTALGDRGGRASVRPGVRPAAPHTLRLSDLLVAAGRPDNQSPNRWFDLALAPWVGRFPVAEPLTLAWEVYDLPEAPEAAYAVEIRVTALTVGRRGIFARIVGGVADALGLSAVGDEVLVLRYDRSRPAGPALFEFVTLELGDTPAGTYRLAVSVIDPASGASAGTEQSIEIGPRAP